MSDLSDALNRIDIWAADNGQPDQVPVDRLTTQLMFDLGIAVDAARKHLVGQPIRRFLHHHVLLAADGFTVEHPPTCDLEKCDLWQRAHDFWNSPPVADLGWYRLHDDLTLTESEGRIDWLLVEP